MINNDDDDLISLAYDVRDTVLEGKLSTDQCIRESSVLLDKLDEYGVQATLTQRIINAEGYPHCWIALEDGWVLDPTADQFNTADEQYPGVYLGPPLWFHPETSRKS